MKSQLRIIFLLGLLLGTAAASAPDISGAWAFSVNLEGGPQKVVMNLVFKQAGEKLTGAPADGGGGQTITGTVKGNQVTFHLEGKTRGGEPYKTTFTGTIESATRMTGTADFPKGPGKWTATKK